MNRILHITSVLLFLAGVASSVYADETGRISIGGNVYGGGEAANVGSTDVTINEGRYSKNIFGGGEGELNNDGTVKASADVSRTTSVTINGGEFAVKHVDAHDPRIRTDFAEHYNIYGGGNIASNVGETHVYVKKGMISKDSDGSGQGIHNDGTFLQNSNPVGIGQAYYQRGQMYFCVFGGGYGKNTSVTGNTWVDFNINGMTDINSTAIEDDLLEYQSWLDVVGGGFNGTVLGNTNVHVGGNAMCRDVYGGGLYAAIGTKGQATKGNTNVYITGGNIDNVYGGGVMGDILTSTNVNIGLHDALNFDGRNYAIDNDKITVLMSVFGGNDVSGRVETANIVHNGGTVNKNLYGAGNGDYKGYYTPNLCDYADGEPDNYYMVDHSGDVDSEGNPAPSGPTYKGRPQTGNVNITLGGKSKEDRATVLGQVFGGGNSCTIGDWDATMLAPEGKYHGDPHLVRDDPDYFLGGGTLNVNLGSHVTIGRTHEQLAKDADREEYIDNGENISGLFMGCSGLSLATQSGDKSEDNHYHHYFDAHAKHYYPGFAVHDAEGHAMSRTEQLKPFQAYLNNIMIRSDNVRLNVKNADETPAEDIWLANFVGGGFRGSMRALTTEGKFDYMLPEGVTVSHTVVGGAYNAHVQYRVFKTDGDGKFVDEDEDGVYDYLTVVPDGWTEGEDYIKTLHEDKEHPERITGILRYNFNGGILSDNSTGVSTSEVGHRIHNVHLDPRAAGITDVERDARYATSYFEPMTAGSTGEESQAVKDKLYSANKEKTLLHLTLKCALEPEVLPKENSGKGRETEYKAHGGNVFGGCFMSGFVEGDSWVDYHCWLAPKCANSTEDKYKYFFNKNDNMHIYDDAGDLETNNALSVYGAGYGTDTHSDGDVYLYIKSIALTALGDADPAGMFPYIFNAFGGSNMGTVSGNTNVYYAVGQQGTLLGSLYGGGYKGVIEGNTFVELAEGFAHNVYGGSRQADIHGASHVWAYDGKARGIEDANHLIICNLYGGNDIAGTISGTMPAKFTESKWGTAPTGETLTGKQFNSYVEISADDDSADRGFPMVGSAYAGGNGEKWTEQAGDQPVIEQALLEIEGGSTLRAFGGGNMATVTGGTYIFTNAQSTTFADVTFAEYQKNIMKKVFFNGQLSGYKWEGTRLMMNDTHVYRLFGGNNLATMDIQPTWNLKRGHLENVYSGGNMGDMTYYNPDGIMARKGGTTEGILGVENLDGTNVNLNPKGLSITINSPEIRIGSLFGGCRMSDVRADDARPAGHEGEWNTWPDFEHGGEDCYGATVNVIDGNIGYIFGGNDVSGKVEHGTNINICGGVIGQVYGSGNGDYLFKYIPAEPDIKDPLYTAEEKADVNITERMSDDFGVYYTVPEKKGDAVIDDSSTGDTHKIMTINKIRPSVDNTFINIAGLDAEHNGGVKRTTLIKGNVYVGGNATTITRGNEEAFSKFKYGSYAVAGGLFFGSDGQDYTKDEVISSFATLNGISDMGAGTQFKTGHEEDARHNPILLNAYLTAVDMEALPKEFAIPTSGLRETYVGTVCGGGNRGSMLTNKTVDLVIPAQIIVFDKVVAGCNDATINYNQNGTIIKSIGGYTRPIEDHVTYGNTKIRYNIAAQFVPLTLDVPMGTDLRVPVKRTDLNNHGETWADAIQHAFLWPRLNSTGDAYTTGCNIYGGCYSTGEIEGDVELNVHSNMLRYANEAKLQKAILNNDICFDVFGAGFGQDSHVWGNVHIKMDKSNNVRLKQPEDSPIDATLLASPYLDGQNQIVSDYATPSANNICGGGRNGQLIGNTLLEVRNGHVYSDLVGGCFASDMYGSSHIIVGYPTYYKCNTSGEYALQRGDQWNGDKNAIKTSVKYLKGDLVPKNVYEQIAAYDAAHSTNQANGTNFTCIDEAPVPADWSNVNIKIGEGIYGGGYSLANSTSASAGSITSHKLQDEPVAPKVLNTLHPLNFNGRYGLEEELNTEGYGGNSTIMVCDQAGDGTTDHISISTQITTPVTFTSEQISKGATTMGLFTYDNETNKYTHLSDGTPVVGTTYYDLSGYGGIYGDGHLTFCEGFRVADVSGYGYNTGTVKYPKLMNTFQRLDLLDVTDCCLMLQGAQDFATKNEKIDATIYSMTRIDELRMNSSLSADAALGQISAVSGSGDGAQQDTEKQRNYLGFFNNVHFLGSIVTNDDFASATFHGANGAVGSNDYKDVKNTYITNYTNAGSKTTEVINAFKQRNVGTARNVIGINNGFCLRIQNQYDDNGTKRLYYGPIVGVCEVKLLTLTQGEGGGYVYADNVHADANNFLNTSGNFVFPGVVNQGKDSGGNDIADQYIVDDCFMKKFGTPEAITTRDDSHALDEAHYWYVEGNKYFYHTTLTGYTYQSGIDFNLIDTDPNVILSGMEKNSSLNIKKIEWLSTHRNGYECVLENSATDPEKTDDYEFDIEIAGTDKDNPSTDWTNHMPRHSTTASPYTTDKTINNDNLPQFNIKLQDKRDNSGDNAYNNHLDEPEKVKIYLEGETDGQAYEYTITLNIVYLQGPTYEGGVTIENCALPGERIGFSTSGITIKTPNLMPVTATAWKILPLDKIDDEGNYHWSETNAINIPESQYSEDLHGNLSGWVQALYRQNEYNIAYIFTAGGHEFPVMPSQTSARKEQRMMVVHNYHRMKYVVAQNLQIEKMPTVTGRTAYAEAKLYIEDEADLRAFVNYLNMATHDNANKIPEGLTGIDVFLQNNITLTQSLPAINQAFAGTFHGDGYNIDLGNHGSTFLGNNLTGKVYNLGIIGGTISSADTKAANGIVNGTHTVNSYEYAASDDFARGKIAYQLSHTFTPGDRYDAEGYVENYYANGDYQYAATNRVWSLRTGEPYYGHTETHHNMAHTHDDARWVDADAVAAVDILSEEGYNAPLYNGTAVIDDVPVHDDLGHVIFTKQGLPAGYANDYLFFGQHLDKNNADSYPTHIYHIATGDANAAKGGNRVFETAGYYRSNTDQKFYYNKDAWALEPALTAIDFTTQTDEGDNASTVPTAFNVDSNKDDSPYSNATTGKVTQNLLVYNNGEDVFTYTEDNDSEESEVEYHNIVNDGGGNYATDFMHLVDKQEFCAPIAFTVNSRAWYERIPANCAESNNSAWEGICLPFTVKKVEAETNGEISHFYGTPTEAQKAAPDINDKTLHHEYWLRGFVSIGETAGHTTADFQRPGTEAGLFSTAAQTAAAFDYSYAANDYFTSLTGYNKTDNDWYTNEHTFNGYTPLTANTPYIVSFPGKRYYEFDLSGKFYKALTGGIWTEADRQTITFSNDGGTTVPVSNDIVTTEKGYSHVGTFLYQSDATYGMNDEGTAFDASVNTVAPFRTYVTGVVGLNDDYEPELLQLAKKTIYIAGANASVMEQPDVHLDDAHHEEGGDGDSIMDDSYLRIYPVGRSVVVVSGSDCILPCRGISGSHIGLWSIRKGTNTFSNLHTGVYVIGGTKVVIRP